MAIVSFIPFVLVMVQPDLGNAVIYICITLGMLWIGNIRYTYVLLGLAAIIGCTVLFVSLFYTYNAEIKQYISQHNKAHWYQRINTYIHPEQATEDESRQARYAKIAIGSGGLSGDGYMQGESKKRKFIPYAYSDSIFVVVGEEFGFQGAAYTAVIVLSVYLSHDHHCVSGARSEGLLHYYRHRVDDGVSNI